MKKIGFVFAAALVVLFGLVCPTMAASSMSYTSSGQATSSSGTSGYDMSFSVSEDSSSGAPDKTDDFGLADLAPGDPVPGDSALGEPPTDDGALFAIADDYGDNCLYAQTISMNSYITGYIDFSGDKDVFEVYMPTSGTITAATSGSTDTYGILVDNSCTFVKARDDDSGNGQNFSLSAGVNPGTYYIFVQGFNSSVTGAYTLYVSSSMSGGGSGSGGVPTLGAAVDVYTNKGGTGTNASGGTFAVGEPVSIYIQMGQSGAYDITIYRSNGSASFYDSRSVSSATTVRYDLTAGSPTGTRNIVVSTRSNSGGYGTDSCSVSIVSGGGSSGGSSGGSGGAFQIDVYTNKGGTGTGGYGGSFRVGEIVTMYVQANKYCTYNMYVQRADGSISISDSQTISAGTWWYTPTAGYPVGTRTIYLEAWTGSEYQQDYCRFDITY